MAEIVNGELIEIQKPGGGTVIHEPGEKSAPIVIIQHPTPVEVTPDPNFQASDPIELQKLSGKNPEIGKIYTLWFYTDRDIQLETPKNLTILGWGIIIDKVYKPESWKIHIDFHVVSGIETKIGNVLTRFYS